MIALGFQESSYKPRTLTTVARAAVARVGAGGAPADDSDDDGLVAFGNDNKALSYRSRELGALLNKKNLSASEVRHDGTCRIKAIITSQRAVGTSCIPRRPLSASEVRNDVSHTTLVS